MKRHHLTQRSRAALCCCLLSALIVAGATAEYKIFLMDGSTVDAIEPYKVEAELPHWSLSRAAP